jgi:type IX secretion system PorP/SprF family membrane protein
MLLKNRFLVFLFLASASWTFAQQDKLLTHFIYDKMSINPGKTGIDLYNGFCGTSIYRNQWDKVNGAPNSALLNVEANLTKFFPGGIGISFWHDAIGFNRANNVTLNYSYPIQISNIGVLGIGLGVGIMNVGMNPDWVPPTSLPDNSLPSGFAATGLDLNFGAYFQGKNFYAGLSSTHLPATQLKQATAGLTNSFNIARHYYLMGGYKLKKIGDGDIDAQLLMRTDMVKFSADINVRYIYNLGADKQLYGGLTYRTTDAIAIMVGYNPVKNFTVGYSYDLTVNKIASLSNGSHELMVRYCYFLPPPPTTRARHPRWL